MNILELLEKKSKVQPEKAAVIFKDNPVCFSELRDNCFKIANYLISQGITKDKKVALCLPNRPEAIYSIFGILSAGAVLVPLDYMLTEREIIDFINHSESEVLIIQPKKDIDLKEVIHKCPSLKTLIFSGEKKDEYICLEEILKQATCQKPENSIDRTDNAAIFYTSGSTGHPKGVLLTYAHLENPVEVIDRYLEVTSKDIFLCGGVPFSHIGGVDFIIFMLYFGFTLVLMERFQPFEFLRNIEKHKVTLFCVVPAMFVAVLFLKGADKVDLSSLRYAVVFGAPSSPAVLKRFCKLCPNAELRNGWGMTETAAPNAYSPSDQSKLASIGKFDFNMRARLADNQDKPIELPGEGELQVKGKGVMKEYYKEPELTRIVLTEDGWLKTGDIARADDEGLWYIVGRKKDMIKVAGEIVFAPEVEEKIHRYPKIEEVAVIGVPDKLRGEVPKAFLVFKDGEDFDESELREFLKKHLAHFKMPAYFEIIKELPKNRAGKVNKSSLE